MNLISQKNKILGFNGHPFTQGAYKDVDKQLKLLDGLDEIYYRIDIPVNSKGKPHHSKQFILFFNKLEKYKNIKILPMFSPKIDLNINNLEKQYNQGCYIGNLFFDNYGLYIQNLGDYIEIGNEIDVMTAINKKVNGQNIKHFNNKKLNKYLEFYRGFLDAARINGIDKKVIFNFSYTHWGILETVEKSNFEYDIIGLHWYSNMGDLYNFKNKDISILNLIAEKFQKKILIEEFNIYKGTYELGKRGDYKQWLKQNGQEIIDNDNVVGVIFYELYDEPDFAKNINSINYNPAESAYGIFKYIPESDTYKLKKEYIDFLKLFNYNIRNN